MKRAVGFSSAGTKRKTKATGRNTSNQFSDGLSNDRFRALGPRALSAANCCFRDDWFSGDGFSGDWSTGGIGMKHIYHIRPRFRVISWIYWGVEH